jgi:hypothetical protein
MEIQKVSRNDWIVVAGAVLMFIGTIGPWYGISVSFMGQTVVSASVNGWHFSYLGWLTTILCVAAGALVLLKALPNVKLALPLPEPLAVMAAGAVSGLIVLLRLVIQPTGAGLRWGIFVALLGAVAVLVGGFLKNAEPAW